MTIPPGRLEAVNQALQFIKDGWVIAVGSGSTVALFLEELSKKVKNEKLKITIIPGSTQTYFQALNFGLPISTLDEYPEPDACFDSADEAMENGVLLKGGGAALMREKILAYFSKRFIVMVEESKVVKKIGASHPVPIEVLPYAVTPVSLELKKLNAKPVLRYGSGKNGPIITDNGNYIIDAYFNLIAEPQYLELKINSIPGVIENGIFTFAKTELIIGKPTKTLS
ncbi:MAG: ribose-5-phosphate isomerase RpiA [Thermoprotei archaeon]|jgi:ribose 5-phosphate isomerase A